jgi:hypothetical protein
MRRRRSTTAFLVGFAVLLVLLALWVWAKYPAEAILAWWAMALAVLTFGLAAWRGLGSAREAGDARPGARAAYALFAEGILLAALAVCLATLPAEPSFGVVSWTAVLALIALGGGLWQLTSPGRAESSNSQAWFEYLAQHHALVARALLGVCVLLIGLAAVLLFVVRAFSRSYGIPLVGGLIAIAVTALSGGLSQLMAGRDKISPSRMRLLVLVAGSLTGLFITLTGLGLAWVWWDTAFAGGIEGWQGENGWQFWVCAYTVLVGLVLLFTSLLLGRPEERTNPVLRRMLYGFNAVLTGLLLLAALALFNVVVYASFPSDYNWTKTRGIYTLSNSSKHVLENLKEPVKVFVLLSQGDRLYSDVHTLLDNCRAVTSKFQAEYLTPDLDREGAERLLKRFPEFQGRGLLVVYGNDSDPKAPRAFIAKDRLTDISRGSVDRDEAKATRVFKGEAVLMSEIRFLDAGRTKPKVYFTQGNHELDLTDISKPDGAGILSRRLKKDNYAVLTLRLRAAAALKPQGAPPLDPGVVEAAEVPADAQIVVVLRPREFAPEARTALSNYMTKNKGKLLVLADPEYNARTGAPLPTGLEDLLKGFNVELAQDYLLRLPTQEVPDPSVEPVIMAQQSKNPIAVAFKDDVFTFYLSRPVRAGQGNPANRAEVIITTKPRDPVWAETNFQVLRNPIPYLKGLLSGGKLADKISPEPLPVAVAVTETEKEQRPRLVVIGNSTLATNEVMGLASPVYYDLFENTLKWLSERPSEIGGIQPLESDVFAVNPARVNWSRMILLPGALMALGIIGLGTGVWVVRRR